MDLKDSRIVLGVSGGIAAFRALDLCSLLQKQGATIRVVMTAHAQKFIAPLSFETLTQHPVYTDLFDRAHAFEMEHISWSKWGQLLPDCTRHSKHFGQNGDGNCGRRA